MLRTIGWYGVIAGLVVGIPLFIITVGFHGQSEGGPLNYLIGYGTMLVALSAIFLAIKRYRDESLGGVIRFWPALGIGLGISFIAGIFYVAFWEAAVAVAHMDFATAYSNSVIAQEKAKGVTRAALAQVEAQMEQFKAQYANPLYRWPMTFIEIFPVGVLISLISAALLQNRRFLPLRRAE